MLRATALGLTRVGEGETVTPTPEPIAAEWSRRHGSLPTWPHAASRFRTARRVPGGSTAAWAMSPCPCTALTVSSPPLVWGVPALAAASPGGV
jgi:hypothetical protein